MMEIALFALALALFTALSAFFSASETALFSLPSIRVKTYKHSSKERLRLIGHLLSHPRDLLVTILIMNVTVNIFIQNIASNLFDEYPGWALKVGVPLVLTLVFGEIVPKSLALINNESLSSKVARPISFMREILGPFRRGITLLTSYTYRTLFFFLKKEASISDGELKHVLETSKEYGVLNKDEATLIKGYLGFQSATVKELMQPREDIILYQSSEPLSSLIDLFNSMDVTRIPVSDDGIDDIKGILSTRNFFLYQDQIHDADSLTSFLHKPFYVPEITPARTLLRQLRSRHEDMALVVDEYGSVTGLITEEDLVEEVVGQIMDRREEKSLFTPAGRDVIIASGKMELAEINEMFDVNLTSANNMLTIGGWLIEQIGDIPKGGTKHIGNGFLFHVLAADPNRIRRIYIRHLDSALNQKTSKKGGHDDVG
ncbi:Uncharacterized protein SCG7109_AG_00160 [Chlamydiales bacterium SCGC AG-110-M15]|nr:Uncharacterized protein SCG7109_AG_00160 [Chlamydiales bacterium SCGC AG-110-M15]